MSATLLTQVFINGVLLGLVYGVIALGLSLTMGVLRIINVSHGAFTVLGAYGAFVGLRVFQQDPLVAVIPVIILFFGLGMLVERVVIRRVERSPQVAGLLALFGSMIVLETVMILIWTTDIRVLSSPIYGGMVLSGAGMRVSMTRLLAAAVAVVALVIVHLALTRTLTGKAIRALAQNRDAASIMGMKVSRLISYVFGLGIALTAIGGSAVGMIFPFTPQDHIRWLAWAFLIVVVGGLGGVRQTAFAAVFVGLVESFLGLLLPFRWVFVVMYLLLAVVLIARREGLAATRVRTI